MGPAAAVDTFTIDDRKEMIRQGIVMSSLQNSVEELRITVKQALENLHPETRIRRIEDKQLKFETELRTFLYVAALLGGMMGTIAELIIHFYHK